MHTGKRSRSSLILPTALLVVAISGCSAQGSDKAAASVDGTIITVGRLDEAVSLFQRQFAAQGQTIPEEQLASFRSSVLDSLVRKTALLNAAEAAGIAADAEEVDGEMEKIRNRFSSEEEYTQSLDEQGYSVDGLRQQIEEDLTISALIDAKVLNAIEIPEDEIVSFFEENSQYFVVPESVTASHILVEVSEDASSEKVAAAREKIESILAELKAGADFAEVAKKRSEGPSGPSGGSLGTFGRGQMVPPFEEAAFSLEPGELSDIVRTQFGFHIILVHDREEGREQTFDEVRSDIADYLRQTRGEDQVSAYVDGVVEAATVKLFIDS